MVMVVRHGHSLQTRSSSLFIIGILVKLVQPVQINNRRLLNNGILFSFIQPLQVNCSNDGIIGMVIRDEQDVQSNIFNPSKDGRLVILGHLQQ